jgi:ABC-2 type transport system permease protein
LNSLITLVQNETLKMWYKKRFLVVLLILAILIPIFTFAQMKVAQSVREQLGTDDWRVAIQQQITDYTNRMNSSRLPEEWKKWFSITVQQLQYYLETDIDPTSPNGVTFAREFMENTVDLFLPLLVVILAADIVSSELSSGTIKLLVSRPVSRWKILLSKLITLIFYISLTVVALLVLSYLISGLLFGFGGWNAPVLAGFQVNGSEIDTSNVHILASWQYILMEFGLAWFSAVCVGMIALMVSVLVHGAAVSMGIMLAAIISGVVLTGMVQSWEEAKYLFMVNLNLIEYLSGENPPIAGMNLTFSLTVLSVWTAVALVVAFRIFIRRDIY